MEYCKEGCCFHWTEMVGTSILKDGGLIAVVYILRSFGYYKSVCGVVVQYFG